MKSEAAFIYAHLHEDVYIHPHPAMNILDIIDILLTISNYYNILKKLK